MKTEYKLKGTRLPNGAIGKPEKFTLTVSRQVLTAREAMDTARRSMYEDGFEHILFTSCAQKINGRFQALTMLEALGLE